jgi:phytoene dehydrogenase-like protein
MSMTAATSRASSRASTSRVRRADAKAVRPARRRVRGASTAPAAAGDADAGGSTETHDVVIVGGGLAGLCAAKALAEAGVDFVLLESSDGVGGRLRTDEVDGFLLDRGFAIFLTGYPEAQKTLDYDALELQPFYAGADVFLDGAFHRVADPLRHPIDAVKSLSPNHPLGSVVDKVLVGLVRLQSLIGDCYEQLEAPETTIALRLKESGFSDEMVNRFFRPFMSGIFFDPKLGTSSRLFAFVMRMLATGQNCLPKKGIGEVAAQLARGLPAGSVRLDAKVTQRVTDANTGETSLTTTASASGEGEKKSTVVVAKKAVVVATAGPDAAAIAGEPLISSSPSASGPAVGTTCLYFAIDGAPPLPTPILYLDGSKKPTGGKLVNNCCFPSAVSPSYAPSGKSLASVSVVGVPDLDDASLEQKVRLELMDMFGPSVETWKHLRTYRIPFAQPNQQVPTNLNRDVRLGDSTTYVCGDHRSPATFDGAMRSGRLAAEAVLADHF